jgi:hypothetical protein
LSDERLAWLVFNIEVPIAQFAGQNSDLVDRDALLGLEYARNKVEKEKELVIVPAIFFSLQKCRYEKTIILPGTIQTYKREEKIRCLDRVIFAAKQMTGDSIQGQKYIQQLIERFAKLNELSRQPKIITPSS